MSRLQRIRTISSFLVFSLAQVFLRHLANYRYLSMAYIDRLTAVSTLPYPPVCRQLLPPCFPGHAAPAWGSRQARGHARKKLAAVIDDADPSAEHRTVQQRLTISAK